jgi:ketosteroid isomerase-like protein
MVWTITTSLVDDMPADSARDTLVRFIAAFRSMDEARFENFLARDIVAFLPCGSEGQQRCEGRTEVMSQFREFFAKVRATGVPAIDVRQTGLGLRSWGDTAMATFELEGEMRAGCRTIVLRRDCGEWRIVHLHVSSAAMVEQEPVPA